MNPAIDLAACRAFSDRWIRARQLTSDGPDLLRPQPILRYQPEASDARPIAAGRDPCPRCNIRGDIGCAHQAPCETIAAPKVDHNNGKGLARLHHYFRNGPGA